MAKVEKGIIPYDPIMDRSYVNAIGSNKNEASINTDYIELSDEIISRLEFIECTIAFTYPQGIDNG